MEKKNKMIAILGVFAVIIAAIILIVTNMHTCEECNKTYLGKKYEIVFFGQSEIVCKDCYNDFYLLN